MKGIGTQIMRTMPFINYTLDRVTGWKWKKMKRLLLLHPFKKRLKQRRRKEKRQKEKQEKKVGDRIGFDTNRNPVSRQFYCPIDAHYQFCKYGSNTNGSIE